MKQFIAILQESRKQFLILGVFTLILGLLLAISPLKLQGYVVGAIGLILIGYSVYRAFNYMRNFKKECSSRMDLALSLLVFSLGVFSMVSSSVILSVFGLIIALVFMFHAGQNLQHALELYSLKFNLWWLSLIFAVVAAGSGIYSFINCQTKDESVLRVMGILLVVVAVLDIFSLGVSTEAVSKAKRDTRKRN